MTGETSTGRFRTGLFFTPGLFAALSLLAGCPGEPPAGTHEDAGTTLFEDVEISVSGTASMHPAAVSVMQSAGESIPDVDGLTLRVEDPLRAALNDPLGEFGKVTLDAGGTFSVSNVRAKLANVGIVAGVRDEGATCAPGPSDGGCRVVRSATALWDNALEGSKPHRDITGARSYAIPFAFHDRLSQGIGAATIAAISGDPARSRLIDVGFMLGQVVDPSGQPVAGARITTNPPGLASQLFYPSADATSAQVATTGGTATSATGLFVFVHTGDALNQFEITVEGRPEYLTRRAGAARETSLILVIYPGTTAP